MNRNRWQARIPAGLAALVAVLAVAQGARAELIPTPTTVTGTGPYTFSYDFKVLGTSQVQTGDFAVIYDVQGFVPGSATGPAGWTVTWSNTGPYPDATLPTDDPGHVNIKWTYTGATISPGGTTVNLTGFSYQSTFGNIGKASFAASTHLDPDASDPNGRQVSNVTKVDVPAPGEDPNPNETPEPATMLLSCFGLAGLGLGCVRNWALRRKAA